MKSISEFVNELFNSSSTHPERINMETAAIDLENFAADDFDMPEGITPAAYMAEWNGLVSENDGPCEISLDNGHTYLTAEEAMPEIERRNLWEALVNVMDDAIRESVHDDLAPCADGEFLAEYLRRAPDNLIIG